MQEKRPFQRRTDYEKIQSGDYYDGIRRYYDQVAEITVIKVFSGEFYVSTQPGEMMVTILGSCVAACVRDPVAHVSGMNHFLLPDTQGQDGATLRYGAFAMEQLINEILKKGGMKSRLEVKVFGGGNVIRSSALIGDKNSVFVRRYLAEEGIKIAKEDLGGTYPRRVHYYPDTGKVMIRHLRREEDLTLINKEENAYKHEIEDRNEKGTEGEVELF